MSREHPATRVRSVETVTGGMCGAIAGASTGVALPTHEEILPGVDASTRLALGPSGNFLDYGQGIFLPKAGSDPETSIGILSHTAIRIHSTEFPQHVAPREVLATLWTHSTADVLEPVKQALLERAAVSAGSGAILGALIAYGGLDHYRTHRELLRRNTEIQDPKTAEGARSSRSKYGLGHLATGLAVVASIAGCASVGVNAKGNFTYIRDMVALDPTVTRTAPLLRQGRVDPLAKSLVEDGIQAVNNTTQPATKAWNRTRREVKIKLPALLQSTETGYLRGQNIEPIVVTADTHCSHPEPPHNLQPLVEITGAIHVLSAGDDYTNLGKEFYEKGTLDCLKPQQNALRRAARRLGKKIWFGIVRGNHDPKTHLAKNEYDLQTETLDKKNGFTRFDAVLPPIVGAPDPLNTPNEVTYPDDQSKRAALLEQQGEILAKVACDAYEKTGVKPLVIGHEKESTIATIVSGCAVMVLSGHEHVNVGPQLYKTLDGNRTLQNTIGSSSGSDNKFPLYSRPKPEANSFVIYYNTQTKTIAGFITETIDKRGGVTASRPPKTTHRVTTAEDIKQDMDDDVNRAKRERGARVAQMIR